MVYIDVAEEGIEPGAYLQGFILHTNVRVGQMEKYFGATIVVWAGNAANPVVARTFRWKVRAKKGWGR